MVSLLSSLLLLLPVAADRRWVEVVNDSVTRVEVFWVNPDNHELSPMSDVPLEAGGSFPLNTFSGHEFELHELPSKKTGECDDKTCRRAMFTISEEQEQSKCVLYVSGGVMLLYLLGLLTCGILVVLSFVFF